MVDSDVLGDLVIARVKELGYGLVIKKEVRDGHLEELCDADVVLLEVLGDSGIISGKELSDSDIEEFGDGDIVGLEEARGGSTQELGHWDVVLEEFSDRDIVVGQELGHSDIIGGKEVGYSIIQELGDGHIIGTLGKELGHRDIILKELCDGGV